MATVDPSNLKEELIKTIEKKINSFIDEKAYKALKEFLHKSNYKNSIAIKELPVFNFCAGLYKPGSDVEDYIDVRMYNSRMFIRAVISEAYVNVILSIETSKMTPESAAEAINKFIEETRRLVATALIKWEEKEAQARKEYNFYKQVLEILRSRR